MHESVRYTKRLYIRQNDEFMPKIVYPTESYKIVGTLFEVHNQLGSGFSEIVYKDALENEFARRDIIYLREKEYTVQYKGDILPHKFYADFVIMDKIILEVKCCSAFHDFHRAQSLNYLKVSGNKLALLANFNKEKLEYERIVL